MSFDGWGMPHHASARKNKQNRAKKSSEIENFEENRRRKSTTFIPTISHDYRNDADIKQANPHVGSH